MARVPIGSPRYKAAVRRTAMAKELRAGMGEAVDQLGKENKIRAIVGKAPQSLLKRKRPPFQR